MARPRAGHGWTYILRKNGQILHLLCNDAGEWIPSGKAKDWRRCSRCRKPFENDPFNSGLCVSCYFHNTISVDEFWRLHDEGYWLAPYNITERSQKALEKLIKV